MAARHEVILTASAIADLESIVAYIDHDSPSTALRVLEQLRDAALSLDSMPHRGRTVPELVPFGITVYRQLLLAPWRIVYRIHSRKVHVVAIVDSRRQLEDLLLERLIGTDR